MFCYKNATLDETIQQVLQSSRQSVGAAKRYYQKKEMYDVVERIDLARKLATIERLKKNLTGVSDGSNSVCRDAG